MKAVLISTRPEWCEKICHEIRTDKNGQPIYEKTIEVRKTKPSIPTPFKCYIYCCKAKSQWRYSNYEGAYENSKGEIVYAQQHVIGEFICEKVYLIKNKGSRFSVADEEQSVTNEIARQSCLDYDDMVSYLGNKDGYGWHISQLKIYDKPKELSELYKPCPDPFNYCTICKHCIRIIPPDEEEYALYHGGQFDYWEEHCANNLIRPPQSWCYVQELEDNPNVF